MCRLIDKRKFDILIALLGFSTFAFMVKYYVGQSLDIKIHNFLLIDYLKIGAFPSPPGYYFLIYFVDFFFHYKYPFVVSSILVLTFFYWWKFRLAYTYVLKSLRLQPKYAFLLILSLLILSPIFIPAIDGPYWYFGKFTPTIWHNSTLISVFPFCILLVLKTLDWFETFKNKFIFQIVGLGIIIMLIKPSFLFCYIPALPFFAFFNGQRFSKYFFYASGISLLFIILLFLEKLWIFDLDPVLDSLYTQEEKSNVVINPLRVHLYFSKEPIFDFISSFPTTFIFFVLWGKEGFSSKFQSFSFILLFFSIAVYLILAETGIREFHGNFYWQIPIAMFLHYLSLLVFVIQKYRKNKEKMKTKAIIFWVFYLVQVGFGLVYLYRLFFGYALN